MVRNVRTNQDNSFEMVIKSLQPFMKSYSVASGRRVKLQVSETADAVQLNNALNNSGGKAERSGGAVYVRFGDVMTNEDAKKIVSMAFGEVQEQPDNSLSDYNFDAMPGELDENQ